jgi:hypothetical protein
MNAEPLIERSGVLLFKLDSYTLFHRAVVMLPELASDGGGKFRPDVQSDQVAAFGDKGDCALV